MKGIDIVIKNQKGRISSMWNDSNGYLFFDCPICHDEKSVKIDCIKSTRAFKTIQYHPHTQLICEECNFQIVRLNGYFKRKDVSYTLGEVYNILKW